MPRHVAQTKCGPNSVNLMVVAVGVGERFKDKTVCFVGAFSYRFEEQVSALIEKEQGTIVDSVSDTLSYLVIGSTRGVSAKQKQAEKLNKKGTASINVLDEDDFSEFWKLNDESIQTLLLEGGRPGIELWNLIVALHGNLTATITGESWAGRDLSHAKLTNVSLESVSLAACNLDKAALPEMNRCNVTGAIMHAALLPGSSNCDFTNCDLSRATVWGEYTNCVFDGASFANVTKGWHRPDIAEARFCSFKNCSGSSSDFNAWHFVECDFSNANFESARLGQCRFENCIMNGASFAYTELTDCVFESCELRDTNFQGATLGGAHFSATCKLENANFARAVVAPSAVSVLKQGHAVGLSQSSETHQGGIGDATRELSLAAGAANHYTVCAYLDVNDKEIILFIGKYTGWSELWLESGQYSANRGYSRTTVKCDLADAMLQLAKRWPSGVLRANSATVDLKGTKLKPAALTKLCNLAWAEVCGQASGTPGEQSEGGKEDLRSMMLADLRGGPTGIARWNARSQNQRTVTGSFRGLDFNNVDLERAEFFELDFRGSSFRNTSLRYAKLSYGDFAKASFHGASLAGASCLHLKAQGADFSSADLTGTRLCRANLSRSIFADTRLERTDFEDCNLCGADLSNSLHLETAQLSGAQFDQETLFPADFVLPETLRWSGAGVDPRPDTQGNSRVIQSSVVDFDGFLQNLRLLVQEDRLLKAMQMLKSDRFKLFSECKDSELIGVVKSQSDPDLVYACRISSGSFGCCTQNLNTCGGLRGAVCKHLLVLLVGLTKSESISAQQADIWMQTTCGKKPNLDKHRMTEVFLQYKGAENGELDWRPTETVPEDYY